TGNEDLWLMKADGAGLRQLTNHTAPDDHGCWAPDGQSIAFVSLRDGGFDIYRMPLPTGVQVAKAPPARPKGYGEPTGGLVAHFDFDEDTGSPVRDLATGRKPLTLNGTKLAGSKGRQALAFAGKDTFASAGNGTHLQISGPLTLSLWVKPEKIGGNG